jgi:hypothetical protein
MATNKKVVGRDVKKIKAIMIRPSVLKIALDKAKKLGVSFSELIEIMVYDFNAE